LRLAPMAIWWPIMGRIPSELQDSAVQGANVVDL